nr:HIT family protein [Alistipes ihumii]
MLFRSVRGEIPSYKVAEDERFFAFLDINPLTKGHTLVVPKQETDYLFDLDDRTLADMIVFAKRIARKLKEKIECKRVAVVVLGLEVPHAHIHLIPIQDEKDVDFRKEKLKLSPDEFRAIADTISL